MNRCLGLLLLAVSSQGLFFINVMKIDDTQSIAVESSRIQRRVLFQVGATVFVGGAIRSPAEAFENRIGQLFPQLKGRPYGASTPVPQGVGTGDSLKGCPSTEEKLARQPPNCFSSAVPKQDREHYILPLHYDKSGGAAMADLVAAVQAYPPGQSNIDGGGWRLVEKSDKYLYVQYESEKIGYIDDLEFLLDETTSGVLIRSASRVGFLDFGVNAKRVNWFVDFLCGRGGWRAERITASNHPDYFAQNGSD